MNYLTNMNAASLLLQIMLLFWMFRVFPVEYWEHNGIDWTRLQPDHISQWRALKIVWHFVAAI